MIRIDMKMPRCCSECPFEDDERWQCNALFGTDESLVKYRQTFQIGRTKRLDICPLKEDETVTEFADRCKECGARYGKLLKQGTTTQENLLQTLFNLEAENERLHDAFDKIRAEVESKEMIETTSECIFYNMALNDVLQIIDKYRKEYSDE